MKYLLLVLLSIVFVGCSANNKPNYNGVTLKNVGKKRCDLPNPLVQRVIIKYIRGPVDGAFDENGDGVIDVDESFTNWDYNQLILVLMEGVDEKTIHWTNIDTCYRFSITPHKFYEDYSQKEIWRTCRSFHYYVKNNKGQYVGQQQARACRNIATFEWVIL